MADRYHLTRAFLAALPAETAHGLTIRALAAGLGPSADDPDDPGRLPECADLGRGSLERNPMGSLKQWELMVI